MRIAIDACAAAEVPAGRGRYVRELLRGISTLDHDNEYLLFGRKRWIEGDLDRRFRWQTIRMPTPGLSWPLIAGAAMGRAADVALACTSYAMVLPWRIPGATIVWDMVPLHRSLRPPRGSEFERLTLPIAVRRCEALIAISESTRDELQQRFPKARGKTSIAWPAADARFCPTPAKDDERVLERHGLRKPYVLVTGTLEPRKNLPRLIEAFVGLDARLREGWTLALVGASGWETDSTFAMVKAHAGLVRTLGFVPDQELACLYRHADLFCYVSLYEGFGIPVLEAMQSGTPVLTSSTSSMPEVGGQAARYVNPYDVTDIRRGLAELIASPELRHRAAEMGLDRAPQFSWSATARSVVESLESIGGSRGAALRSRP